MSKAQASRRAAPVAFGLLLSLGCSSSGTVLDVEERNSEADGSGGNLGSGGEDLPDAGSGGSSAGGSSAGTGGILMEPPGAGGSGSEACAASEVKAERVGADILLLLDASTSMSEPASPSGSLWAAVTDGISRFLENPLVRGADVGLQVFPKGGVAPASCTADYLTPDVPVGAAGDVRPLITDHLLNLSLGGSTPTGPALAGAIAHMQQRGGTGRLRSVVLITDGFPTECTPLDLPGLAALAAEGQANGVLTHVVTLAAGLTNYSLVAEAGALSSVYDASASPTGEAIAEVLTSLVPGTVVGCVHALPSLAGGEPVDIGLVNVRRTTPAGSEILYALPNAASCTTSGGLGWYPEGSAETGYRIHLCEEACGQDLLELSVVVGCPSVPPPP